MRTGPTKQETRDTIVKLEKYGKKTKKAVWKDLAKRLKKPSRIRAKINVYRLNELAEKNKDKILVIAGKVLAKGNIEKKIEVACFTYSEKAKEKIIANKGTIISLTDLIDKKISADKMVIIQ